MARKKKVVGKITPARAVGKDEAAYLRELARDILAGKIRNLVMVVEHVGGGMDHTYTCGSFKEALALSNRLNHAINRAWDEREDS